MPKITKNIYFRREIWMIESSFAYNSIEILRAGGESDGKSRRNGASRSVEPAETRVRRTNVRAADPGGGRAGPAHAAPSEGLARKLQRADAQP